MDRIAFQSLKFFAHTSSPPAAGDSITAFEQYNGTSVPHLWIKFSLQDKRATESSGYLASWKMMPRVKRVPRWTRLERFGSL